MVFNIVQAWKTSIAGTDVEEIRAFACQVRKSGMTIQQCAKGFRTIQMLKEFDIKDKFDEDMLEEGGGEDDEEGIFDFKIEQKYKPIVDYNNPGNSHQQFTKPPDKRATSKKNNELSYFLESIYKKCKDHGISPTIIVKWIEDVFYCYSLIDKEFIVNNNNEIGNVNAEIDGPTEMEGTIRNEMPFISRISYFIEEKRKKITQLEHTKRSIYDDINEITKQKMTVISDLKKTVEKEKRAVSYFNWYNS